MSAHTSEIVSVLPRSYTAQSHDNIVAKLISRRNDSHRFYMLSLLAILPIAVIWALSSGAVEIDLVGLFFSSDYLTTDNVNKVQPVSNLSLSSYVLWEIRLPRVGMTIITGAGLAICGAVLQTLCRNPLADPGLVGVSSGAALFAAFGIMFVGTHSPPDFLPQWVIMSGTYKNFRT